MNLKALRKSLEMTQQQFADSLGLERITYIRYENGTRSTPNDVLKRIAEKYNVTTDYLLGRDEPTDAEPVYTQDDPEFWELREQLRRRPEMRTLFSVSKNATSADLKKAIKIIETLKGDDYDDPC